MRYLVMMEGVPGSGKSTLLKVLLGAEFQSRGEFRRGSLRTLYIDQKCSQLDDSLSVLENVRAVAQGEEGEIRTELAKFLFVKDSVFQKVGTFSGGERLRAALACGLLAAEKPELLILDEPTNNLDPASREQVLDALRSYVGAVVLVTHDPGAAEALGPQRVVLLPDGSEDFWSDDYRDLIELA